MPEDTHNRIRKRFHRLAIVVSIFTTVAGMLAGVPIVHDNYLSARQRETELRVGQVSQSENGKASLADVLRAQRMAREFLQQRGQREAQDALARQHHPMLYVLEPMKQWTVNAVLVEVGFVVGGFLVGWLPVKVGGWVLEAFI